MKRTVPAHAGHWRDLALCAQADPEAWFPGKGHPGTTAKMICARCPVAGPCLDFAVRHGITWGIWGGLGPKARYRLRRRQGVAA